MPARVYLETRDEARFAEKRIDKGQPYAALESVEAMDV